MTIKKSTPRFIPSVYKITPQPGAGWAMLEITGQKFGAPNKRLTLNQKGLKVKSAKIVYSQKNKVFEHEVSRINHLPSFEEVRLHTNSPLYPGNYTVSLEFKPPDLNGLIQLVDSDLSGVTLRELLPSFDDQEARSAAKIELVS